MAELKAAQLVRDVPDFPKPGIMFKDITPVVQNHEALKEVTEKLTEWAKGKNADLVLGIEARGFIFGTPVALELGVGFVPLRKLGKLPANVISEEYELEYGTNTVEIHADSIQPGQNVVIIDDLLATGGTAAAAARLVERLGGNVVGFGFLISLDFLEGRKILSKYDVHALLQYE